VLADAGAAGVHAVVLLSSGFGEDGPAGRQRQRDLVRLVRAQGIRLVGPNRLGVINTDPQVPRSGSLYVDRSANGIQAYCDCTPSTRWPRIHPPPPRHCP